MGEALQDLSGMFGLSGVPFVNETTLYYLRSYATVLLLGMVGSAPVLPKLIEKAKSRKKLAAVMNWLEPAVYVALLAAATAYLVDGSFNPFLYFRF